jgi:hypothetical protein
MENLVWLIPVLACPLMMVAMMLMMGKGMRMGRKSDEPESPRSVDELRAEQQRLASEVERLEQSNGGEPADAGDSSRQRELAHRSD